MQARRMWLSFTGGRLLDGEVGHAHKIKAPARRDGDQSPRIEDGSSLVLVQPRSPVRRHGRSLPAVPSKPTNGQKQDKESGRRVEGGTSRLSAAAIPPPRRRLLSPSCRFGAARVRGAEPRKGRGRRQLCDLSVGGGHDRPAAAGMRTGRWPSVHSGGIAEVPDENWKNIHQSVQRGCRGLPGGTTLACFLEEHRGKQHNLHLPHFSQRQVLAWADAHLKRTGEWPQASSGPIAGTVRGT